MRARSFWPYLLLLLGLHLAAVFAAFLAPYPYDRQHRDHAWSAPSRLRLADAEGRFSWRPHVHPPAADPRPADGAPSERAPGVAALELLPRVEPYRLLGLLPLEHRLFGVAEPGRVFLCGTDGYGRDLFSRILYGARVSLFSGLLAAALALGAGTLLGALAGFYGRWIDTAVMRLAELFMALPWLYLLLGVRAFLPLALPATGSFLVMVAVIGVVGWAVPARLVRGQVLAARGREYVAAARGFGATDAYLLGRHLLPEVRDLVLTQAAILVPRYILAEVTLSFLGLGIGEPVPSWGSLLGELGQYRVLASYWWMTLPAAGLVVVCWAYHGLSRSLAGATIGREAEEDPALP